MTIHHHHMLFDGEQAAQTYGDFVIGVRPIRETQHEWGCSCFIHSCVDGSGWSYELDGFYPTRRAAFAAAFEEGQRQIDARVDSVA